MDKSTMWQASHGEVLEIRALAAQYISASTGHSSQVVQCALLAAYSSFMYARGFPLADVMDVLKKEMESHWAQYQRAMKKEA